MSPIKSHLRLYTALITGLLILIGLFHHEPINPDGILYLQAARTYMSDGLNATLAIYNWPFYPILIAYTQKITHFPLWLYSAHLLNLVLGMLFAASFVTLIQILTPQRSIHLFAALVIILYPELNRTAQYLSRDCGYWVFTLLALINLLRFSQSQRWSQAILFGIFMFLAFLFRIEGILLWALLPFSLFFNSTSHHRLINFLKSQSILILLIVAGLLTCLIWHKNPSNVGQLDRVTGQVLDFSHVWQIKWLTKVNAIENYVLTPLARDNANTLLFGGSLFVFAYAFYRSLGLLYLILSLYGIKKRLISFSPPMQAIFIGFILINFFILSFFAIQEQFLQVRYVVPLAIPFLCYVPFSLQRIFQHLSTATVWRYVAVTFIILLGLTMLVGDVVHTGPSKIYIYDAGNYLRTLPPNTKIFSNSPQVMFYYADRVDAKHNIFDDDHLQALVKSHQLTIYNYLALIAYHNETLPGWVNKFTQIKEFKNARGDRVIVFKLQSDQ